MNRFTEGYKTLSNPDLLKVIDSPNDYQPLAVEAAKIELVNRNLTNEELADAQAENNAELQEIQNQNEKKKIFEIKVKNIGNSIADTMNPIQSDTFSANKGIIRLSLLLGLLFFWQAFDQFGLLKFMLTNKDVKWDFSSYIYLLQFIFLPVAVLLFWKIKRAGWIMLCIYLTYSAVISIIAFYRIVKIQSSGDTALFILFPLTSPATLIVSAFFFGACLWFICKNSIRDRYYVNKQTMLITAALTIIAVVAACFK